MPHMASPCCVPGLYQGVEDAVLILDRVVQFPAQLAHEVDPHRNRGRDADGDGLRREPGECLVGEVGVGHRRQDVARARPRQHQHAVGGGDVLDGRTVAGDVAQQEIVVVALGRA